MSSRSTSNAGNEQMHLALFFKIENLSEPPKILGSVVSDSFSFKPKDYPFKTVSRLKRLKASLQLFYCKELWIFIYCHVKF